MTKAKTTANAPVAENAKSPVQHSAPVRRVIDCRYQHATDLINLAIALGERDEECALDLLVMAAYELAEEDSDLCHVLKGYRDTLALDNFTDQIDPA